MAWCPNCKNEYVDGVTICVDCGCELVATLEEANRCALTFGRLEEMQPVAGFLKANGFATAVLTPSAEDDIWELFVEQKEYEKAQSAYRVFQREQLREASESGRVQWTAQEDGTCRSDEDGQEQPDRDGGFGVSRETVQLAASQMKQAQILKSSGVYQKSSEKAEEFKSSAYVLLLVGILGFAGVLLAFFDVLPISLPGMNRYLIAGVLGAMFVLFIVMGVVSFKSSRTLLGKAAKEDELTREILGWCRKNLSPESMDGALDCADAEEEIQYFKRAEYMRGQINNQFMNLDESYLDQLIDEYYQEIYG